jgi:DNA-binding transcriptional regulator PaaX
MSRTDVGDCSSISILEQFAGSLDLTDEREKKDMVQISDKVYSSIQKTKNSSYLIANWVEKWKMLIKTGI